MFTSVKSPDSSRTRGPRRIFSPHQGAIAVKSFSYPDSGSRLSGIHTKERMMIGISERAAIFPDSPIRKLVPFAEAAKAKGRIVYPMNIGQPDIKTPQPFMDTLHHYSKDIIAYGMSQGEPSFREALVGYYRGVDIDVNMDD